MGRKIWTRVGIPGLATATALCSWMALSPAQADSTFRVPAGATSVLVEGQGFGHGHGMSQYGAKVAAEKGLSQRQIMAHYYPGTGPAQAGGSVRVLLSTRNKLAVRNQKALRVKRSGGKLIRLAKVKPKAARSAKLWRAVPSGTRTLVQFKKGSTWRTKWRWSGDVEFSAGSQPVTVRAGSDSGTFRGAVRLARKAGGSDRDLVNRVSLEQYVRGVVAREMPALWAPAAVQAQAVAARSYAVHERETTNRGHFDVYDTVQSQVYAGVGAETAPSNRAVAATRGEIRSYQGKPAITQFSSSNGGWMLANSRVPYLKSGRDPYDPVNEWQVRIPLDRFAARFPSTYPLDSIKVFTYRQAGDWVEKVTLIGKNGKTNTISGSEFRSWAGLKSASFNFSA